MSEIKITPFSFGESDEDIAQVQADTLPGATEPKKEEEDKSQKTEKEEIKPEKGGLSFFDPGEEEIDEEEFDELTEDDVIMVDVEDITKKSK